MKYKVRFMMDEKYQVVKLTKNEKDDQNDYDSYEKGFNEQIVYQGRLADCEAYIRLNESGYM